MDLNTIFIDDSNTNDDIIEYARRIVKEDEKYEEATQEHVDDSQTEVNQVCAKLGALNKRLKEVLKVNSSLRKDFMFDIE